MLAELIIGYYIGLRKFGFIHDDTYKQNIGYKRLNIRALT